MYDELIKRLRNCATQAAPCKTCDMTEDGSCSDTLMKQAADAIEVLSKKENTTQWIPVTERLPEKDTRVIVCASLPEGVHSDFIYEDGHWFVSIGVTHWMPLPESPKEET